MDGISKWQWYGAISYAQHGDDFALLNIFKRLGVEQGSYIDVGAHDPLELSNTALLYNRGWCGINVEANPDLLVAFDHHRQRDHNINAAVVGSGYGRDTITLCRASPTSGINSTVRESMSRHGIKDEVEVPAVTLPRLVDEYARGVWPHLVSIDAEGADIEILRDVPPRSALVVLVEAVSGAGNFEEAIRHWASHSDYFVHSWCGHNILLVQRDLHDRVC